MSFICVNPLHIGELISTVVRRNFTRVWNMCQSPSHRRTHFYVFQKRNCRQSGLCQSPSHRRTHFYKVDAVKSMQREIVSIPFTSENSFLPSTLLFVDFMRVSSLDFRGIFQTILKTAVFSVSSTFLSVFYKRAEYEGHVFL